LSRRPPVPFGKYLLTERLSIGGMAEVWRAITRGAGGFDRVVAIKRILPYLAEDEMFISMLLEDARIAVQLNHANIAQVFEAGRVDEFYFLALEYVSGRELSAVINRCRKTSQRVPIELAIHVIARCCDGLDHAHRMKAADGSELEIVHREVAPHNVMITFDGEVKVIDFMARAANNVRATASGRLMRGKLSYMSPEQVRGKPLDRRSDIFLLGSCLYELTTGVRLFQGDSDFAILEKTRICEIEPPTVHNPAIPSALEKIILKALAKDPAGRYPHASELAEALAQVGAPPFSRDDLARYMRSSFPEDAERERVRRLEDPEASRPEDPLLSNDAGAALLKSLADKWGV
jgi:serine/threonine protein kinase